MNVSDLACITLSNSTPSTANLNDIDLSIVSLTRRICSSSLNILTGDWPSLVKVYIAGIQNRLTLANLGRSASSSFTLSAKYLISLSRDFSMLFVASLP